MVVSSKEKLGASGAKEKGRLQTYKKCTRSKQR